MKSYKVKTKVKDVAYDKEETIEEILILGDNDDLAEFVQMSYGSWNDIISFESEEVKVSVSKTYIAEEAMKMVRFE